MSLNNTTHENDTKEVESTMLTISEVAKRCNVSTKTVRRWINQKELESYVFGKTCRTSIMQLNAFLDKKINIKKGENE